MTHYVYGESHGIRDGRYFIAVQGEEMEVFAPGTRVSVDGREGVVQDYDPSALSALHFLPVKIDVGFKGPLKRRYTLNVMIGYMELIERGDLAFSTKELSHESI